jgi:hypothetical protein
MCHRLFYVIRIVRGGGGPTPISKIVFRFADISIFILFLHLFSQEATHHLNPAYQLEPQYLRRVYAGLYDAAKIYKNEPLRHVFQNIGKTGKRNICSSSDGVNLIDKKKSMIRQFLVTDPIDTLPTQTDFRRLPIPLKVHKHFFFFYFFCRNRNLMVPRACNMRFLKIVFDSAEIFDF